MRGSEFADLKAFCAVAEESSFARAAARLGVSASALSQTVRGLEERLDVRLLNRTTRSVTMTQAGAALFERVSPLFGAFAAALVDLGQFRAEPAGAVRINAPRVVVQHLIVPKLGAFQRAYPAIELEIAVENRITDIVAGRFDAGIRLGERLEKDMVAVRLGGELGMAVVASPDYLARHGAPATPQDLHRHACIRYRWPSDGTIYRWEFEREGEEFAVAVDGPLIVNDSELMIDAAIEGVGIAYLLDIQARAGLESGKLVSLLPEWTPRFPGFYLYHSGRRQRPPTLQAFIDVFRR
ncbi:LysR family transcriptional regulator [Bosea caraganae]|uniref:LysR family transcriptional regulator n=1 Tax=Bosea caraganae TaxID=2763117 RepID=A0A370LBI0_9HYPH|nr:LysR family transcriptional regulator [Bosea caraganae]RDJ27301.1 LysR family transcriptional regulator [Bosea caraganae]RDJ29317.1 LysR family transcriptional regulator [Bosea caraganae]